jgi:hypothetical protein
MELLARVVFWLNAVANAVGRSLLAPIAAMPGWLSATLIAVVTGVLLLAVFKYTSNQNAIKRTRNDINAHLLALKLFKDSTAVCLRAQGRILLGALRLFVLAIVPMLVMAVPVTLLLEQLALWYQFRPLRVGEETVVTMKLSDAAATRWPEVRLEPSEAVEVVVGPVRVRSKREVCWRVAARNDGAHDVVFRVDGEPSAKRVAIGDRFVRLDPRRPSWEWSDILMNPDEEPFRPDSAVQSIELTYPDRPSWTSGTDWWVVYWFGVSFVAAICFRGLLKVNL